MITLRKMRKQLEDMEKQHNKMSQERKKMRKEFEKVEKVKIGFQFFGGGKTRVLLKTAVHEFHPSPYLVKIAGIFFSLLMAHCGLK